MGVCGGGGGGSCTAGLGEYEDATINQALGWFNEEEKTFKLILTILPNLSLYHFTYQSAETGTQDLLYLELFRMPKKNVLYSAMENKD